ncbi:MAG: tetratricopeptide repeat protein [Phormidesmis sp.]
MIINGRLSATELLSETNNIFSPPEVKTFEAIDLETHAKVILRVTQSENPDLIASIQEAVLALRQVHLLDVCPGIMQLASQDDGYFTWQILPEEPESHFMATQKVEGTPLDAWSAQHGPIDEETAVIWLKHLIESADALHRAGFLHRDIKPANIVRRDDGQLVLIDLGAVRYIDASQSLNPEIQQGRKPYPIIGTPGYEAREQALGHPNHTCDYFSIGRTLIHLLTGIHPVDLPASDADRQLLIWRDRAQVSAAFADLIDRLAAPNQIYRPLTAEDILEYLDSLPSPNNPPAIAESSFWHSLITKAAAVFLVFAGLSLATNTALSVSESRMSAERLFARANRLIATGLTEQAVPVLERAAELAPENVNIRASLGLAYTLTGNADAAIDSYDVALDLKPNDPEIHYNLAGVYEQIDPQQAIANYQIAAREGSPIQDEAINNLARVYILEDELAQAEPLLERASQDPFTQATLYKNKGWLLFEQGSFDQAQAFLNQSIDLDPTRADAYCLLSLIQRQQERPNWDDETACLSLPTPEDRPEVQGWKKQLLRESDHLDAV